MLPPLKVCLMVVTCSSITFPWKPSMWVPAGIAMPLMVAFVVVGSAFTTFRIVLSVFVSLTTVAAILFFTRLAWPLEFAFLSFANLMSILTLVAIYLSPALFEYRR